jgi:undecaprenyl-diphosphatase
MAADQSVFVPDQCHHHDIEDRQHDEAETARVRETVELVDDEEASHLIISKSPDWSFPSDHATASIAIVAAFALQGLPRRTLIFGLLALLICWSRIFVGTHYLTDVLGGSLTGVIAAMLVWVLYREGSRLDRFATGIL